MTCLRRACVVVLTFGTLGALSLWAPAQIRINPVGAAPVPNPPNGKMTAAISLPIDSKAQRNMERVRALIEGEQWADAVEDLQKLLDRKEDGYVKSADSRTDTNDDVVSFRYEAARLIGNLPAEALKFYEDHSGPHAAAKLAEARKKDSVQEKRRILREIVQSYLHTRAGAQAVELLGTDCLERGEYQEAALRFKQRLGLNNADEPSPQLLLKAALAFSRVDDKTVNREALLKELTQAAKRDGGVRLGTQLVSVDQIADTLNKTTVEEVKNQAEWQIARGNPSRTAQGVGGAPHLEPSWTIPTTPSDGPTNTGSRTADKAWVEEYLTQATKYLESKGLAVLPAFHPVAVNGKVIFRTYDGLWIINLRENDPDLRHIWLNIDGGAAALLGDSQKKTGLDNWKASYLQQGPHGILFENSITGTVTTDGIRAFIVDDLLLPPNNIMNMRQFGMMGGTRPTYGQLNDQAYRSSLKAYNLETGKVLWDLGGKNRTGSTAIDKAFGLIDEDGKPSNNTQQGSFFLGPPLPLNGKLYVLHERGNDLRLMCLEAKDKDERIPPPPELVWMQPLVTTRDGIEQDFNRRIHAAHLAYGEGILVCPTNAGAILGVDLLTHSLVWVHRYREGAAEAKQPGPNGIFRPGFDMNGQPIPSTSLINEWKATPPAITDGKVVFAAPDGNALHCLSLHRGKLLWKVNRDPDDLYFAGVFNGKAVVVSKNAVKAFNLADGKEVWRTTNTGMPGGQGVASDNIYYLPVKASAKTKEPEIVAIDLVRGSIIGQTPAKTKRPGWDWNKDRLQEPGNLIFYEGQVISQTLTSLVSYPQVQARMAEIDNRIRTNPRDVKALVERGELRLGKGELRGAIDDLHNAIAVLGPSPEAEDLKPLLPRVRGKLYDSLTRLIDRQLEKDGDFGAVERYLKEYEELCKSDNAEEQLARQGDYLSRLAKGREQQGRLVDAFDAYLKFGELVSGKKLVRVSDQLNTEARPDVWARGRISAMIAKATPERRKPLEDRIAKQWEEIKDTDDLEKVENFVALFGSAFEVGKQAKLRLAERLLKESNPEQAPNAHLRAQLLLLQLRDLRQPEDRPLAGQAVEALARLMIQKNELGHAALYYQELGRDFGKVVIREGKTGSDLFNEIVVDKRFLPYLEPPKPAWKGGFTGKEVGGNYPFNPTFTMEPLGPVLPFFQRHRVSLEANAGRVRFIDQSSGDIHWEATGLPNLSNWFVRSPGMSGHYAYSAQGHVCVMSLGHMVYAFDPVEKRKLWEYNLFKPGSSATEAPNPAQMVADRYGRFLLLTADGFAERLGQVGTVEAGFVCMQTRSGLTAIDPVKGPSSVLWIKSDVSPRCHVFGDEEYIYVVDMNKDGHPTSAARAVRGIDGVTVAVPDFAELYAKQIRISGRNLLVKEDGAKGELVLRLYDVLQGKDLWREEFPAKSVLLRSDDANLTGVVDPEGKITVLDIRARKEVLKASVQKEDLDKLTDAYLLADRDLFYIVLSRPMDPQPGQQGDYLTNVHASLGTVRVNGSIHAFERMTGQLRWANPVSNQMLVLEQFKESPLLLFTVRYVKRNNQAYQQYQMVACMNKQTGKRVWPPPGKEEMLHGSQQPFAALRCDPKNGVIELEQFSLKMQFKLDAKE